MKRRSFLASAAGILLFPAAGSAVAKTVTSEPITVPPKEQLLSSFGFVTDVHYAVKPTWHGEDTLRVYAHSMQKLRMALDLFNTRDLDFAIELGDFKDCQDGGTREGTLNFLETVEKAFQQYNGPRFHVAGNHDFDLLTYEDYLSKTPNAQNCNGRSYYAFTYGGVKYIVLDACFNSLKGDHYSEGNFDWKKAYVPTKELDWFAKELNSGSEPVIVFSHQNLNYFDAGMLQDCVIPNAKDVVALMEKSGRVLAHISGHHHPGFYSHRNGIHYIVAQGMVEQPLPHNVCGIVHVDRDLNVYLEGIWNEVSHTCLRKAS